VGIPIILDFVVNGVEKRVCDPKPIQNGFGYESLLLAG
jgi:hypothetical protein